LIDAYHAQIQPWLIQDPTLTIVIIKSIKAFIDDVAMSVGYDLPLPILMEHAQTQLQWRHQLIQASSGTLNPQKCCYTV